MRTPGQGRARAGFTLTEVMLGAFLMGSLLLVAGLATDRCMALFRQRRASQEVNARGGRLLQRVASELAFARRGSLQPATIETQGSSSLQFQKSLGVAGGVVQWSPVFTLSWESEPAEFDDGQDNDGDGLADEGQLVWIENEGLPGERRAVLGHGLCELLPGETFDGADEDGDGLIDERGLCFSIVGDLLTVRVGVQGNGPDGRTITKVVETAVFLRN
jgi:hypothetical protein